MVSKPLVLSVLTLVGTSAFPSDVPFVDYVATPINAIVGENAFEQAFGISNSGLIVGNYSRIITSANGMIDDNGLFLYNSKNGSSTLFNRPDNLNNLFLSGVNSSGIVIGSNIVGSLYQGYIGTPGALVPLTFPGSISTEPVAINDAGVVVGNYLDASDAPHGFIYQPSGTFQTVDGPPGLAGTTSLIGINNVGQILGGNDYGGGIYLLTNGTYTLGIGTCGLNTLVAQLESTMRALSPVLACS